MMAHYPLKIDTTNRSYTQDLEYWRTAPEKNWNPSGTIDPFIRRDTLRLATPEDFNTENEAGKVVADKGMVFWVDMSMHHLMKFKLTGDPYQRFWLVEWMGKRVYVIK